MYSIVSSMHNKGKFANMRIFLSSRDEVTFVHCNETCLHCEICIVREDQIAALDCDSFENGCVDINKQTCSNWHID